MYIQVKVSGNGHQSIKYVLDLQSFVVNKLPDDGTLVAKWVGVGT